MVEQIKSFKWPTRTHESHNTPILNTSLTTISHLHYPRDLYRYAPSPWETSLHCNDVSHWLGAYLDWSLLSVMLINAAFSLSNEECSHISLVITHQSQARDDIDGLMQERRNSIANALEYVFLAPSHPHKECHYYFLLQCNEIDITIPQRFFCREAVRASRGRKSLATLTLGSSKINQHCWRFHGSGVIAAPQIIGLISFCTGMHHEYFLWSSMCFRVPHLCSKIPKINN